MLVVGDKAPDFSLQDADGITVSLENFRGQTVVVYFYPKDDTPGCTKEACSLRDGHQELLGKNAVVLGISADSTASHARFREKYKLPFRLLSDPEKTVIKAFGAWGLKKMMGKEYEGILRSTFVIGGNGTIQHVFDKVDTGEHARQVLAVL